ncbi:MAG TPA: hypothetical protein VMH00_16185 [Candidatus Limnocylindrales bacterium]|nr:hypothetical protein [Candidatus Limnocylindrales bacterium]
MKVLVTFALETEFAPWRAMRRFRPAKWGQAEAFFAQIGAAEVGVVLTGVGPKQAATRAAQVMRSDFDSVGLCISSGLAGAVRPAYQIAQVLAARTIRAEDAPERAEGGTLKSSDALLSFAEECGATPVGQFYSASRVIGRAEEKQHIGHVADAVEMESFEILREAAAAGIPAIALRAISDLSTENLPLDMGDLLNSEGKVSIPRVVGQVALHPTALPDLVKLGQNSKRAAESLAQFLDRYIATVADRTAALETRTTAATS